MTGAVERSTFSSGTDSKDSSFSERAGGGHKLRPGLTLRPKSRSVLQHCEREVKAAAAAFQQILHCTLRADSQPRQDKNDMSKKYIYIM